MKAASSFSKCASSKICSLTFRRNKADILFLHKTISEAVDSSALVMKILFRVPRLNTHASASFHASGRKNIHNFISRSGKYYNGHSHQLDVFLASIAGFAATLKNLQKSLHYQPNLRKPSFHTHYFVSKLRFLHIDIYGYFEFRWIFWIFWIWIYWS